MTDTISSTPTPDWPVLGPWLEQHADGFHGLRQAERIVGGNSNPIWLISADSGRYVLRTQPAGVLLKSAHALDREVRVLQALATYTNVPVARVRATCDDSGVIGVGFYLMDCVDGEVHRDPRLPGVEPARRTSIYDAAIRNLARIHAVDIDAAGLRDFGRPGHYFQRQLHRWTQQVRTALPEGEPHLDQLIAELGAAMPDDEAAVLLHGDARLDNLMFRRDADDVAAVLDWELSTLGHPLADLGQFLAVQALPSDYGLPGLAGVDRSALGIPAADAQAALYCAAAGRPALSIGQLRFFLGFAMFRQAAMSAGLKRRAELGTAVAESALYFGNTIHVFSRIGLELLHGDRIP